ncbi:MAG: glycosyltransferase [Candidatus Omnitrophica bacterium]|nr:glycosyltransferase [Candidatus Omnitrophota bacterium]
MLTTKFLVSVIVPVYNEEKNIINCLRAIKDQTYSSLEFIVVDNASNDRSKELAKDYADKLISEYKRGITFAKNTGLSLARGELVATTDADCIPDKDWLDELVKCFSDPSVGAAGGLNIIPSDSSDFEKCIDFVLKSLGSTFRSNYAFDSSEVIETFHNPGCNAMYRRGILEELGGFNEQLLTTEDEELDFRIRKKGYKVIFTPFAKVYHRRRSSWKKFAKQIYRYSIGRMQFIRLCPDINQWPRFMPSLVILFSLYILVLAALNPVFLRILISEIIIGIMILFFLSWYLAVKSKMPCLFRYFALLFLVFWVWGIGFMRGIWYRSKVR